MARAPYTTVQPPAKKTKKQDAHDRHPSAPPAPQDAHDRQGTARPAQPIPAGPPSPTLQGHGVQMPIQDANDRVEQITAAHKQKFGTKPTPGLVFDIIRAGLEAVDVQKLFDIPRSRREARDHGIASTVPEDTTARSEFELSARKRAGAISRAFGTEHGLWPFLTAMGVEDTRQMAIARADFEHAANLRGEALNALHLERGNVDYTRQLDTEYPIAAPPEVLMSGLGSPNLIEHYLVGPALLGASQIVKMPVQFPFAIKQMAAALGFDARDVVTGRDVTPQRTKNVGKAIGVGVYQDVRHPLRNPGYLALDIWGAISLGTGFGARLAATGKALAGASAEGASIFDMARLGTGTILKRPAPGYYMLGPEGHQAVIPLSENAARRFFQRRWLDKRQAAIMAKDQGSELSRGMSLVDHVLKGERKVNMEWERNMGIQFGVLTAPAVELARLTHATTRATGVLMDHLADPIALKNWRTLRVKKRIGVETALKVIMTDDTAPWDAWQSYHLREIRDARDQIEEAVKADVQAGRLGEATGREANLNQRIANHKVQMEALDLAAEIIRNPPKRFKPLLDQAFRQSATTDWVKVQLLGADETIFEQQIGVRGAMVRGETLIDLGEGRQGVVHGVAPEKVLSLQRNVDRVKGNINRTEVELRKFRAKEKRAPIEARLAKHHERLDLLENELEQLRGQAVPVERAVGPKPKVTFERENIGRGNSYSYHAKIAGRKVGRLSIQKTPNGWEVLNAVIDPALKRNGIGAALFRRAEQDFPGLQHSNILTEEGKAYAAKVKPGEASVDELVNELRRGTEGSAYSPWERELYARKKQLWLGQGSPRQPGMYGYGPERGPVWYKNTGRSIWHGDTRLDTSTLLIEDNLRAARAVAPVNLYNRLWEIGKADRDSAHTLAVRNVKTAPKRLKEVVAAVGEKFVSADRVALMDDKTLEDLRKWMYPSDDELNKILSGGKHGEIRWINPEYGNFSDVLLGLNPGQWRAFNEQMGRVFSPINEPFRVTQIFATPAYLLNAGGQAVVSLAEGTLTPSNMMRAMRSRDIYGPEATRVLDSLAGETMASALVTERTVVTKLSQGLANAWQQVTDKMFRRMTVIYELRRRGILHDGMSHDEVVEALRKVDEQGNMDANVLTAARQARGKQLDFSRMTWPEQALARHLIFIYTFMRASTVWAARFPVEHPLKAIVGHEVGEKTLDDQIKKVLVPVAEELGYDLPEKGPAREKAIKNLLGGFPDWYVRHGYVATGNGKVFDPLQFNMPIMLTEMAYPFYSLVGNPAYTSPWELMGPTYKFGARVIGNDAESKVASGVPGRFANAFMDLLRETSFGYARERVRKGEKAQPLPLPPFGASTQSPETAALSVEQAGLKEPTFKSDDFWRSWGLLIGRTAIERHPDGVALMARYWRDLRDKDPEAFVAHQKAAVQQLVTRQEQVLGQKAPEGVRRAVDLVEQVNIAIEKFKKEWDTSGDGKSPGVPEKDLGKLVLNVLLRNGDIDKDQAKRYQKALLAADTETEARRQRLKILFENGGKAWKEWNDRVSHALEFHDPSKPDPDVNMRAWLTDLNRAELGDYKDALKADSKAKWEYARNFSAYQDDVKRRTDEISNLRGAAGKTARALLRLWMLDNQVPVTIGGRTFPSYEAMRLARAQEASGTAIVRKRMSVMVGSWATATPFDRELVYQRPSRATLEGWHKLEDWMRQIEERVGPGARVPNGTRAYYAKLISKENPDFAKDYAFDQQPKAARMLTFKPIVRSRYASQWKDMLNAAVRDYTSDFKRAKAAGNADGTSSSYAREVWSSYRAPKLRDWIETQSKGFQDEVQSFVVAYPDFIESLVR